MEASVMQMAEKTIDLNPIRNMASKILKSH